MNQLAKVFELDRQGVNLPRGLAALAVLAVPLIVLTALDLEIYWTSLVIGALVLFFLDTGGDYPHRVRGMALGGLACALITLWGFGVGGEGWGLVVLSAFVVTLLTGLSVKLGMHRLSAAVLLNVWFLIAIAQPVNYALEGKTTDAWKQALATLIGAACWIALTFCLWLIRGREPRPVPFPEIPGDTSAVELTRPIILFAVIRAVAVTAGVAIAVGFDLPNADWLSIATLVAMKPSLQQSTLVAEQRMAGTLLGAGLAALFLLVVDSKHVLEAIVVIFGAIAGAIRFVNYAFYTAAVVGGVLIAAELPHPSDLHDVGEKVVFTFVGLAIAVVVMWLASLLQKSAGPAAAPAT